MEPVQLTLQLAKFILEKALEVKARHEQCKTLARQAAKIMETVVHLGANVSEPELRRRSLWDPVQGTIEALRVALSYVEEATDRWYRWVPRHVKEMLFGQNTFLAAREGLEEALERLSLALNIQPIIDAQNIQQQNAVVMQELRELRQLLAAQNEELGSLHRQALDGAGPSPQAKQNKAPKAEQFANADQFCKPIPQVDNSLKLRGWICDNCLRSDISVRYRCEQCDDFDLCGACYNENSQPLHHSIHHAMRCNIGKSQQNAQMVGVTISQATGVISALGALEDLVANTSSRGMAQPITQQFFQTVATTARMQTMHALLSTAVPEFIAPILEFPILTMEPFNNVTFSGANGVWAWFKASDRSMDLIGQPLTIHLFADADISGCSSALTLLPPGPRILGCRSLHRIKLSGLNFIAAVSADLITTSLSTRFNAGSLSEDQALPMLFQIADGLAVAHTFGVIHGQLSPANVLLRQSPSSSQMALTSSVCLSYFHLLFPSAQTDVKTFTNNVPEIQTGAITAATDVLLWARLAQWLIRRETMSSSLRSLLDACNSENAASRPADGRALMLRLSSFTALSGGIGSSPLPNDWFTAPRKIKFAFDNRETMTFAAQAVAYCTHDVLHPRDSVGKYIIGKAGKNLANHVKNMQFDCASMRNCDFVTPATVTPAFDLTGIAPGLSNIIHVVALPSNFFDSHGTSWTKALLMQQLALGVFTACDHACASRFKSLDLFLFGTKAAESGVLTTTEIVVANLQGLQRFLLARSVLNRLVHINIVVHSSSSSVRNMFLRELQKQVKIIQPIFDSNILACSSQTIALPVSDVLLPTTLVSSQSFLRVPQIQEAHKSMVSTPLNMSQSHGVFGQSDSSDESNRLYVLFVDTKVLIDRGTISAVAARTPSSRYVGVRSAIAAALLRNVNKLAIAEAIVSVKASSVERFASVAAIIRATHAAIVEEWENIVMNFVQIELFCSQADDIKLSDSQRDTSQSDLKTREAISLYHCDVVC